MTSPRLLAAFYFCYFAAVGVFEPYLTPFWRDRGFSPAQVGLLYAILPAVTVIAPFLWTAVADLTGSGRAIFLANTWVAAAAAVLLPALDGFLPAAAAALLFALVRAPLIPMANSFSLQALAGRPHRFAAIRLWGTVGYILAAVGTGLLLRWMGLGTGIYGIAVAMTGCGLVGWAGRGRRAAVLPPVAIRDLVRAVGDPRLLLLLGATGLARVSSGPYDTFFTIHLGRLGFDRTFAGCAWALAATSELALMLAWPRIGTALTPRSWLTAALGMHAARWLLSMGASTPASLLLIQLTHAVTFGAFYLAAVQEVDRLAPPGVRASAQGLFSSLSFGLGGTVGDGLSGLFLARLGMRGLYAAAAGIAAAATALYWAGSRPVAGGEDCP